MATTKRSSSSRGSKLSLLLLIPSIIRLASNAITFLKYEVRVIGKKVLVLSILGLLFTCLLMTTWLGVLALFFLWLTYLQVSTLIALSLVVLFNFLFLAIIGFSIMHIKKNIIAS